MGKFMRMLGPLVLGALFMILVLNIAKYLP